MVKKSQAALEFLTTYAWAFLVILIMIGALAYFGILKPSKILPDRCNFGTEVSCVDYRIDGTANTVGLRLKNSVGEPIKIPAVATTGIDLSSETSNEFGCTLSKINTVDPPTDYTWNSGALADFLFINCNTALAGFVRGDKAKVLVTINYYLAKTSSTYTHKVDGEVFATVT